MLHIVGRQLIRLRNITLLPQHAKVVLAVSWQEGKMREARYDSFVIDTQLVAASDPVQAVPQGPQRLLLE